MDDILIYLSKATKQFDFAQLRNISQSAQSNNSHLDISGMLLFSGDHFLQVLEGPSERLELLFHKIKQDDRHTDIEVILRSPIEKRLFGSWAMGVLDISQSKQLDREKFRIMCEQVESNPGVASRAALQVLKLFRKHLPDPNIPSPADPKKAA